MTNDTLHRRFAIRLIHLNVGWRYWAFERHTARDVEVGLDPNGYPTQEAAEAAVLAVAQ